MSTRSQSLSSMDTPSFSETFQTIYSLLNKLQTDTTRVRDGLKSCSSRIMDRELNEQLLEPRPHAVAWFQKRRLQTPCELEDFMKVLFGELAAQRRICHRTRTLLLDNESAKIFGLKPDTIYKWMEFLEHLPKVFY